MKKPRRSAVVLSIVTLAIATAPVHAVQEASGPGSVHLSQSSALRYSTNYNADGRIVVRFRTGANTISVRYRLRGDKVRRSLRPQRGTARIVLPRMARNVRAVVNGRTTAVSPPIATKTDAAVQAGVTLLGQQVPTVPLSSTSSSTEVGMRFTPKSAGSVTAIRFYKGGLRNSGTHRGSVWSQAGVRLASVTFTDETASGWQTAALATPLAVTPGITYVVSYYAKKGRYSTTPNDFLQQSDNEHLLRPARAGSYVRRSSSAFPTVGGQSTNYFVDVVFTPSGTTPAPTVSPSPSVSVSPTVSPSPSVSVSPTVSPSPSVSVAPRCR